jgi:homoserine kinase
MTRRRFVRVPASSANLGPGFDCMAAALALHLELEVEETGLFAVRSELAVPTGRENLCVRAFERLHPADGFEFRIRSEIPLSGGLGSSAAAIVAGLTAADHLFELDADLFALASELEGHPDNVAAALNGGFVICADREAVRFEAPTGLEALAVVPRSPVRTRAARAALDAQVPLQEAVFNVAHGALLTLGLARGDWDLVSRGLQDRLHQERRSHLFPRSYELALRAPARRCSCGASTSRPALSCRRWHRRSRGGRRSSGRHSRRRGPTWGVCRAHVRHGAQRFHALVVGAVRLTVNPQAPAGCPDRTGAASDEPHDQEPGRRARRRQRPRP